MVLTRKQSHTFITQFNNIKTNQPVQISAIVVNYLLRKFEYNKNPEGPQGLKLYLKEKRR